jgi:RNA polymerase sigma-70 factor (ECF subfamily)
VTTQAATLSVSSTGEGLASSRPSLDIQEQDIVEQAKCDPAAFGQLYDRYFGQISRYVFSRVHDRATAEDVTSEVFLKALKNIRQFHYVGIPFNGWLYQIAARAVADHFRRDRGEVDLEEAYHVRDGVNVADEVIRRDRSRRIWNAIDRLPSQQRMAMVLKFSEDRSLQDVGRMMEKSPAAAKLLIYRAVRRLRQELPPVELADEALGG